MESNSFSKGCTGSIEFPKKDAEVPHVLKNVEGKCVGCPDGSWLWLVTYPLHYPSFHPQGHRFKPENNRWVGLAAFGADENELNTAYDLILVMAGEKASTEFEIYLRRAMETNKWRGFANLPAQTVELSRIKVHKVQDSTYYHLDNHLKKEDEIIPSVSPGIQECIGTIDYPTNKSRVPFILSNAAGKCFDLPDNYWLWLFTYPQHFPSFHPQGARFKPEGNRWEGFAAVGADENECNTTYDLILVMSNDRDSTRFEEYLKQARKNDEWKGFDDLPKTSFELARITIYRQKAVIEPPEPTTYQPIEDRAVVGYTENEKGMDEGFSEILLGAQEMKAIYQTNAKRFFQLLCTANGITSEFDDVEKPIVYIGNRAFDKKPVLFYIAVKSNNELVKSQLLDIALEREEKKKCIFISHTLSVSSQTINALNNNNVFLFRVEKNNIDDQLRFKYMALAEILNFTEFSYDELTRDGYQLSLNPHHLDGCIYGSKISPTKAQFRILLRLAECASRGVSKDELFDLVYEMDKVENVNGMPDTQNPLDSHLTRLRKLLDANVKKEHKNPSGKALIVSSKRHGTVTLNLSPEKVIILP